MLVFNKYFYKNKKSKLYFGDRVVVLNDFIYQTGGSMYPPRSITLTHYKKTQKRRVLKNTPSVFQRALSE
jgi:hypothetical protein